MASASEQDPSSSSSFSMFSQQNSRVPDDTVFYAIFPDASLNPSSSNLTEFSSFLQSLHLQILHAVSTFTSDYIWQHEPFNLSISSLLTPSSCLGYSSSARPHLHGKLRFGDNLEDEWFTVFLLFHISKTFPSLSIRVWDTDGEFLLIEAAFHLPRWVNPENSLNRVFIRNGDLHIVPKHHLPNPNLIDSLKFLLEFGEKSRSSESVQLAVKNRISDYPDRAGRNIHRVRVRVPVSVAQVLKHEPCFVSLAVEGFYDRDIDTMKFAAKMEKFLPQGKQEELISVSVKMSRAMYAQLAQQTFQAPKCYPTLNRTDSPALSEAELGMKVACGFEMMYQLRRKDDSEGKGRTWEAFRESLEKSGYFQGLLPGSREYQRLMQNAEEYYRNSLLFLRESDKMSAPVRRIDDILALPYSSKDFRGQEVPPSDDDSWLYNGEDELNSALLERQKEMELYNLKQEQKKKKKKKSKEQQSSGPSTSSNVDEFDLGDIAKTMQAFVQKVSSYQGAEVPKTRDGEEVDIDFDRFIKEMESVMKHPNSTDATDDAEIGDGSSSDWDFDQSEDGGSDIAEPPEDNEGENEEDTFMESYSDALNKELKTTTLKKSFIRANELAPKPVEGTTSNAMEEDVEAEEEFAPVDVDVNLVKSFLNSFSSQQGLPGPASNLLGLMGVQLPKDPNNHGQTK